MTPNQLIKVAVMRLEDTIECTKAASVAPPGKSRDFPYPERREAARLLECALTGLRATVVK